MPHCRQRHADVSELTSQVQPPAWMLASPPTDCAGWCLAAGLYAVWRLLPLAIRRYLNQSSVDTVNSAGPAFASTRLRPPLASRKTISARMTERMQPIAAMARTTSASALPSGWRTPRARSCRRATTGRRRPWPRWPGRPSVRKSEAYPDVRFAASGQCQLLAHFSLRWLPSTYSTARGR